MAMIGPLETVEGVKRREDKIERLTLAALYSNGAHHKQWYLEQILDLVAGPESRELMNTGVDWEPGVEP
jgi:hypothetical protein